ncbi:MAG: segregation protein B [Acidobacteria bacterium]|nr:segregation protein B [Acidobacteriota bacterium]
MSEKSERIAIAGASSLLGKELAEELQQGAFAAATVVLLDEGEAEGKLEEVADEVTFIQKLEAAAFEGADYVFFCGSPAMTKENAAHARATGAAIIDLTYELESERASLVRAPMLQEGITPGPDLDTRAVISAHPAAIALALIAHRLQSHLKVHSLAATVLLPASEHGRAAMDELHQQTVNLLSFQSQPKEQFDAQIAFNLLPSFGNDAKFSLTTVTTRIRDHYATLGGGQLPELALQVLQVPVFHALGISLFVELNAPIAQDVIESALGCEQIDIVMDEADPPTNLSAAGQPDILARVSSEPPNATQSTRFWVWLTADNLKLATANAVACAQELKKLRPSGTVQ